MAPEKSGNLNLSYLTSLAIFSEIAVEIAVPVVVFSMIGKWLDQKYQTAPYLLIASFVLAFALTAYIIWKRVKYFEKLYKKM
ncbi:MAG: AtpZ/AtpI family protein [bacterium]